MSDFTRLGCSLWTWDPWVALDCQARMLWLALYTTGEAKRIVPGLWHGGISTLAEAAQLENNQVWSSLDVLLEHDLVEYDRKLRVIHLTVLPDAGERPMNGKHILGWWNRFISVPKCAARDAHVHVLRWLIDQGKVTEDHEACWGKTFGDAEKIAVPPPRARSRRRLVDESDTSTPVQPSLFASKAASSGPDLLDHRNSSSEVRVSDTVVTTVCDTHTDTDPDTDTDIFSSSEEGRGSRGGDAGGKPILVLVPMPVTTEVAMFDPHTLTQTLQAGLGSRNSFRLNAGQEHVLTELVEKLAQGEDGIGDADLPVLSEWLKCGGMRLTGVAPGIYTQVDWWLEGDHLARSVRTARVWKLEAEERRRDLAQARDQAGV